MTARVRVYKWHPSEWMAEAYLTGEGRVLDYQRFVTWREAMTWATDVLVGKMWKQSSEA